MSVPTKPSTAPDRREIHPVPDSTGSAGTALALQLCLLLLLAALFWNLLGPEPQTAWTHRLRLAALILAACFSCGLWTVGWPRTLPFKLAIIAACLAATLSAGIASIRNFDAAGRILARAHAKQGRIVHDGIGLSYPLMPDFQFNLEPKITRSLSKRVGTESFPRLQLGEVAVVCEMIESTSSKETHGPAWIMLEVQRGRIADLNTFVRDVRREELKWAEFPNFEIIRPTHLARIAGIDMVEFEFVKEPQHLIARQVYLRTDTCVMHFLLNTEVESDRPRFDEFLNSIRLESSY